MYGHCSDFKKHEKYAKNRQKDDLIRIREKKIQFQPDSNPLYHDSQYETLTTEPLFHRFIK